MHVADMPAALPQPPGLLPVDTLEAEEDSVQQKGARIRHITKGKASKSSKSTTPVANSPNADTGQGTGSTAQAQVQAQQQASTITDTPRVAASKSKPTAGTRFHHVCACTCFGISSTTTAVLHCHTWCEQAPPLGQPSLESVFACLTHQADVARSDAFDSEC